MNWKTVTKVNSGLMCHLMNLSGTIPLILLADRYPPIRNKETLKSCSNNLAFNRQTRMLADLTVGKSICFKTHILVPSRSKVQSGRSNLAKLDGP